MSPLASASIICKSFGIAAYEIRRVINGRCQVMEAWRDLMLHVLDWLGDGVGVRRSSSGRAEPGYKCEPAGNIR